MLAVKVVYIKHALKFIEPGKLIFWHDLVAVGWFVAVSLGFETWESSGWTPAATLALLYQGLVVAGLCFAIQAYLLRRHSASQITVFSFATPVCGVTLAVLLRGDPLSPWLFLSTAFVAVGILLVQRPTSPE